MPRLLFAKEETSASIYAKTNSVSLQASKLQMKQSMGSTSTKSAHSLETSASVEEFSSKQDLRGLSVASFEAYRAYNFVFYFLFALVFINNCLILGVSCFQLR